MLVIPILEGVKFLSDDEYFQFGLPPKCIFDKGKVGCGGTTIALRSLQDYVIAVPFVAMIKSKVLGELKIDNSICGVYGDTTDVQIREYNESHEVKKYMVTYDSLERLLKIIDPSKFKLLVDEYHILFTHYGSVNRPFRKDAVHQVLRNYKKFQEFCFMSATPLEDDFILEELKEIQLVRADWPHIDPIMVQSVHCKNVDATTCSAIQRFLSGEQVGNAYFFVNSVKTIKYLIEQNDLTEDNTRVIYSQSNPKELSIPRSEVTSAPKKINFLTSAAFEGCDIEDEDGRVFIISDHRRSNTLIDISTSFMQISGRIRNTRYKDTIVHFYSKTRYSNDVSYEDYKTACDEEIAKNLKAIALLNQVDKETRDKLDFKEKSSYISKNPEGFFVYDANLVKMDLYQFKLTRLLYGSKNSLHLAYVQKGFEVVHINSIKEFPATGEVAQKEKKMSYKEQVLFIKSTGLIGKGFRFVTDDYEKHQLAEEIFRQDPELEEALSSPHIGFEGAKRLGYKKYLVERELIKTRKTTHARRIADLLEHNGIKIGFYSNTEIKEQLDNVFRELKIRGNPVAKDIEDYFHFRRVQESRDGKRVHGYVLSKKRDL